MKVRVSIYSKIRKIWLFKFNDIRQFFVTKNKKRLFLDCGSNLGQGVEHFREFYPMDKYDYVLFEPNPTCLEVLKKDYGHMPNVEIVEAAVWTEDGSMKLYGLVEDDRGDISDGASLLSEHNTKFYDADEESAITIPTIDFSKYLDTKLDYDEIIVKMNIEGSEYDVLEKLIENNQIKPLKYLFMGFHAQFMTGDEKAVYEAREHKIKKYLNNRNKLYIWH